VKVAAELHKLFGELRGCDVVEIGGGYGGQARILKALHPSVNCTIIDLSEACMLARTYLLQYRTDCRFVEDVKTYRSHHIWCSATTHSRNARRMS
jgi:putative sugar O-methyltransferase